MPNTIALFSSARRHGNTGRLMDRIAAELAIEVVDLAALRMAPYDYEHRHRGDDFEPLMRRVLAHHQIIFASPIYWYAVAPAMKVFLDRVSDFLDLPELLPDGRRLRGKTGYVVCTSASAEPAPEFVGAFRATFSYLGMRDGGMVHADCTNGYVPAMHDPMAVEFAESVRKVASRDATVPA